MADSSASGLPFQVYVVVRYDEVAKEEWLDLYTVSHNEEGARTRAKLVDAQSTKTWQMNNRAIRIKRLWLAEKEPPRT